MQENYPNTRFDHGAQQGLVHGSGPYAESTALSEVDSALSSLANEIDHAYVMANQLVSRLESVTRNVPVSGGANKLESAATCPLSGRLRDASNRIAGLRLIIENQLNLLEL